MDLWNPEFCELFDIPIPEDVLSLVDEVPQTASDVVTQVHKPFRVVQGAAVETPYFLQIPLLHCFLLCK
jgi:hypothetical protein